MDTRVLDIKYEKLKKNKYWGWNMASIGKKKEVKIKGGGINREKRKYINAYFGKELGINMAQIV